MKRFLKLFLSLCLFAGLFLGLFFKAQASFAEDYRVLVLPDNIQFDSTNYYIYPDSSIIFASDTINELKKDGQVDTVSMTEIRDALRKNTKLSILTKKALKEFKYNYNIPFVDFKSIAKCFNTNKILVITSQTDVQSFILRRTIWDLLNIPGASVIDPSYKMSTYAALIDVDKEQVLWQNTFYKKLSTVESRILAIGFAPATEQLERIKSYSSYELSPHIAQVVKSKILPPPISGGQINPVVDISNKKSPAIIPPFEDESELNYKMIVPSRSNSKSTGETINDL